MINRVAGGLLELGLKRGDVLSIFLPSLPELIIGYLAAVRAGLTVNVVNAMLREQEVAYILKDCATRAVLVDTKRLPILEAVKPEVESLSDVIVLGETASGAYFTYDSVQASGKDPFEPVDVQEEDLCHLMYTSGTTGWPKGVMATHRNVWHNATHFGKVHFQATDTIMVATPIFHCWGLVNGTFGMLSRGGCVITVERFHPDRTLNDIERLKPTIFQGVPPMFNLLLRQPDLDQHEISSVVFCLSAATKMPENLIRQVEQRLNWRYAEAWGLTEVSCVGTTAPYQETRIGSCGRGMDDGEIKVVDEHGETLPPGKQVPRMHNSPCSPGGFSSSVSGSIRTRSIAPGAARWPPLIWAPSKAGPVGLDAASRRSLLPNTISALVPTSMIRLTSSSTQGVSASMTAAVSAPTCPAMHGNR